MAENSEMTGDENASGGRMDRRRLLGISGAGVASLLLTASAQAQTSPCREDALDKMKRTGIFNLGAREAAPPYGFKDRSGNWVGFSTDIARAIHAAAEKEVGRPLELKYIPVTSQTRIPLLQNGTIDIEAGATIITQPRVKVVSFTVPHFVTSTGFLVPADSKISKLEDLGGKRLGFPSGGGEALVRRLLGTGRIKPEGAMVGFPDHPQGFTALETGSIGAYVTESPILFGMVSKSPTPARWRVNDPAVDGFLQGMPIRTDSPKFKTIADLAIVNLFTTGAWQKLYDKYFGPGSDSPYPQGDMLKALAVINSWPET